MFVAQKLARKVGDVETQIAFVDVLRIHTCVTHQLVDHGLALGRWKVIAFVQCGRVFAHRERLDFFQERFQILALQVRRDFLVIPGVGGVGRQLQRENQVVRM